MSAALDRCEEKLWFNEPGTEVDVDEVIGFASVLESALSDLVLTEEDAEGAFVLRRYGDLLGRPADAFEEGRGLAGNAHIDRPEALRALDLAASTVPSLVTGHLELHPDEHRLGLTRSDGQPDYAA